MWWRRCASPVVGSTASAGWVRKSWARCMPRFEGDFLFCWTAIWKLLQTLCHRSAYGARFVSRHHRQDQDHFILDQLPDVHVPGRQHAVDMVVGFGYLAQALRELQLHVNRDGDRERTQAALANQLYASPYRNPQTWLAVACPSPAQVVLHAGGRALHLRKAWQLLHTQRAPLFQCGMGKVEAVNHPRLRHKGR